MHLDFGEYTTRYPETVPLKRLQTKTVAEVPIKIYGHLGMPQVLSDLNTQTVSNCMKEVSRLLSIKLLKMMP